LEKKKVKVEFRGGTNVPKSPQFEYLTRIFAPLAKEYFGIDMKIDLISRGFARGGGIVSLEVNPIKYLKPINLIQFGRLKSFLITVIVSGDISKETGQRVGQKAYTVLKEAYEKEVYYEVEVLKEGKAVGNGIGVIIVAKSSTGCLLGTSALGGRNITAEKVGKEAAAKMIHNLTKGGCVDDHLQDQLILYCALAKGTSSFRSGPLTRHTETSLHFVTLLTGVKFTVTSTTDRRTTDETSFIISCTGIGLENKYLV